MSTGRTKDKIKINKNKALTAITSLLENAFISDPSKADKLSFWFQDYVNYLNFEKQFDPTRLKSYKRGDVIKVNFGFRLGCELGGLHYAVVLDNRTSIKSPMLTVVPLTSQKNTTDIKKLPPDRIFLGYDIISKIVNKCEKQFDELEKEFDLINNGKIQIGSMEELTRLKKTLDTKYKNTEKIYQEIKKMKYGSIASIGQITTISKLRIQDPKSNAGVLSGIRLSNENLDAIDKKICELFIHNV